MPARPLLDNEVFSRKLLELSGNGPLTEQALAALNEHFNLSDLEQMLRNVLRHNRARQREFEPLAHTMLMLAKSNYEIRFAQELNVSERIIFPSSPSETNGIEDARFVRFTHDDGQICYYATYTAYDGRVILPQMLEPHLKEDRTRLPWDLTRTGQQVPFRQSWPRSSGRDLIA